MCYLVNGILVCSNFNQSQIFPLLDIVAAHLREEDHGIIFRNLIEILEDNREMFYKNQKKNSVLEKNNIESVSIAKFFNFETFSISS